MLYFLGNSRSNDQYDEMVRLEAACICLFCPEQYGSETGKEVLLENDTWIVTENDYPYTGTKLHLLLLPKEHVSKQTELSPASQAGFWDILKKVEEAYGFDHYVLASRNGEPRYTGATILHLHIHLIVSDPEHRGDAIAFYASSRPTDSPLPT